MAGLAVEVGEAGLHRGYVREDAVWPDEGQDLAENLDGVAEEDAIDHHLGIEVLGLGEVKDAPDLDEVLEPRDVRVVDADLVVEAELLGEPGSHASGADDEDAHAQIFLST